MHSLSMPTKQARAHHRHDLRTLTYVVLDDANGGIVRNLNHEGAAIQAVGALRSGGVLICETFAMGNERYGRPSNPAFLLRPDELLHSLEPLAVVAFEQGLVSAPKQAVIQRVCAVRADKSPALAAVPAPSGG